MRSVFIACQAHLAPSPHASQKHHPSRSLRTSSAISSRQAHIAAMSQTPKSQKTTPTLYCPSGLPCVGAPDSEDGTNLHRLLDAIDFLNAPESEDEPNHQLPPHDPSPAGPIIMISDDESLHVPVPKEKGKTRMRNTIDRRYATREQRENAEAEEKRLTCIQ